MISFFCERTAEYAVVPAFSKVLRSIGEPTPLYFWKTREGNNTSTALHNNFDVHIIAFFARRPKVNPKKRNIIQCKINAELYDYSKLAFELDIPVFCGLPVTSSIFELESSQILWFHVAPNYNGEEPVFNLEANVFCPLNFKKEQLHPLMREEIIEIIKNSALKIPWGEAVCRMNELNRRPNNVNAYMPWWMRNWHYKPLYFLIK